MSNSPLRIEITGLDARALLNSSPVLKFLIEITKHGFGLDVAQATAQLFEESKQPLQHIDFLALIALKSLLVRITALQTFDIKDKTKGYAVVHDPETNMLYLELVEKKPRGEVPPLTHVVLPATTTVPTTAAAGAD